MHEGERERESERARERETETRRDVRPSPQHTRTPRGSQFVRARLAERVVERLAEDARALGLVHDRARHEPDVLIEEVVPQRPVVRA